MKPHVSVLTLGVSDLNRALAFYRDGLGLPTEGIVGTEFEDGAVAFFRLNGGLTLALWPVTSMAKEAGLRETEMRSGAVAIAHNVGSRSEVDDVIGDAAAAGAVITDPPRERFWGGYAGYFQDLDGHIWEIAWNPHWPVPDQGSGPSPA